VKSFNDRYIPNFQFGVFSHKQYDFIKSRPTTQQYKVYADIRRGSLDRGRQTRAGLSTTAIFSVFAGYFFRSFRDKTGIIISII